MLDNCLMIHAAYEINHAAFSFHQRQIKIAYTVMALGFSTVGKRSCDALVAVLYVFLSID